MTVACPYCRERWPRFVEGGRMLHRSPAGEFACEAHDFVPAYDLVDHITRQREFSLRTFGPGPRTKGILDHIRKELIEIEKAPGDLEEWVDLILLGLDGAHRAGHLPQQIAAGIRDKHHKNENRTWPDWRTQSPDRAIEHNRKEKE